MKINCSDQYLVCPSCCRYCPYSSLIAWSIIFILQHFSLIKPKSQIPRPHLSDGFDKTKLYVKRDDFDFNIVNFPFLDGDVPRSTSYGVYISQLIRFARVSSHVDDFHTRNKVLSAKRL